MALVLGAHGGALQLPKPLRTVRMDNSSVIFNYVVDSLGTSVLKCAVNWDDWTYCRANAPEAFNLPGSPCNRACPPDIVVLDNAANNVVFNANAFDRQGYPYPFLLNSKNYARKLKRIDSSIDQGFSWFYSELDDVQRCKSWLGGDKELTVHNSGEGNELDVNCIRSDVGINLQVSSDCCQEIVGIRSPNRAVHVDISGNGYLFVRGIFGSLVPWGYDVNLSGEFAQLVVGAYPGFNSKIVIRGKGTPGGPDVLIFTCPKSSPAGAPAIDCSGLEGRACTRAYWSDSAEACGASPGRRLLASVGDVSMRLPAEPKTQCPHRK